MTVTVSLYNHTAKLFADGSNSFDDTYKVKLLTAATFNATHTTLAETGGTEVAEDYGYYTDGETLTDVTVETVNTNDAAFYASDVTWSATGGSISAAYAILYNSTDIDSPPVAFINFGGTQTADDGTEFKIIWSANGIISFTTT